MWVIKYYTFTSLTHLGVIDLFFYSVFRVYRKYSAVYWFIQLHSCDSVPNKLTYLLTHLLTQLIKALKGASGPQDRFCKWAHKAAALNKHEQSIIKL